MAVEGFEWVLVPHKSFSCNWEGYGIFLGTLKSRMSPKGCAEEWVPIAEALAAEHGGAIPNVWWLIKNGYKGLDHAMRNHPELFEYINQVSLKGRTPEEWVAIAEALAKEHGGILPNSKWLIKNGYSGLDHAMRNHPELFARIPQAVINNKTKQPQVRLDGEITSVQREVA